MTWLIFFVLLALVAWALDFGVRKWLRFRPLSCPGCQNRMRRLSELEEDEYLDESQQAEENLGAIDYDVWLCSGCGEHTIRHNSTGLTSISICPRCASRTLEINLVVLEEPTYEDKGYGRIDETCAHCGCHNERSVTLPLLTNNSGD